MPRLAASTPREARRTVGAINCTLTSPFFRQLLQLQGGVALNTGVDCLNPRYHTGHFGEIEEVPVRNLRVDHHLQVIDGNDAFQLA